MSHTELVSLDVQLDDRDSLAMMDDFAASTTNTTASSIDAAQIVYQQARRSHWNKVARELESWTGWGGYYHRRLTQIYQSIVAPGQRVLELGCGRGDLLASLKPATGVGVDFSEEMIRAARQKNPHLKFVHADAHELRLGNGFDVIILSDLVNDLWDVQAVFHKVRQLAAPRGRIVINAYSRLWEPLLKAAQRLHLAKPTLYQNWLTVEDITGLLNLADCEVIKRRQEILWPFSTFLLSDVCNRFLVKLWPFRHFALTNVVTRFCESTLMSKARGIRFDEKRRD